MYNDMEIHTDQRPQKEPATYVRSSIGPPDLSSISNRLKSLAALLAAEGMTDVAEHLTKACGALAARVAARQP